MPYNQKNIQYCILKPKATVIRIKATVLRTKVSVRALIPIILIFFPWVLKRIKSQRNGRTNIGYLVNYLTNRLAEKI